MNDHERRSERPEVVELLVRHRKNNQRSDRASLHKEVGDLVYTDPFAFLIGAAFDRGSMAKGVADPASNRPERLS